MLFVPVLDQNNQPLMPTSSSRAKRWIRDKKATYFWKRGIFCVRLNQEPSAKHTSVIAVGIDPGSKKEGYTVKSEDHTYLNINADAVTWVKDGVETRGNMRRARRFRKTPCRKNRSNRRRGGLAPSTKARWQWKLRICRWLMKMFPITTFVVEDISASTKKGRKWNLSFSPLQIGKKWFYDELSSLAHVETKQGWETAELRTHHLLAKIKNKMAEVFSAHCVDSWILANWWTGGHLVPDNEELLCISPLRFHRRQLHVLQPTKGGYRKSYGGTRSLGFKRGSLIKHIKFGLVYVGGFMKERISLHSISTGKRLTQSAKPADCTFRSYNSWRSHCPERRFLRPLKEAVSTSKIYEEETGVGYSEYVG